MGGPGLGRVRYWDRVWCTGIADGAPARPPPAQTWATRGVRYWDSVRCCAGCSTGVAYAAVLM
eukprot:1120687-Rhodomonas_salina.1